VDRPCQRERPSERSILAVAFGELLLNTLEESMGVDFDSGWRQMYHVLLDMGNDETPVTDWAAMF
jgi:hypothetical protein